MLESDINFKNYYLKKIEKLDWIKKPKIIIKKEKNNHLSWFPDGQINLYENCISKHLNKNKNKIAIITVSKKKKI